VNRTNNYLKNQLTDSKRLLDRSVESEREKNKTALSRLQQQIVGILESERKSMRAQFLKQSKAVNSMIESIEYDDDDSDDSDGYDYIADESEEDGYDYI
jgi:hypothetical protein